MPGAWKRGPGTWEREGIGQLSGLGLVEKDVVCQGKDDQRVLEQALGFPEPRLDGADGLVKDPRIGGLGNGKMTSDSQ